MKLIAHNPALNLTTFACLPYETLHVELLQLALLSIHLKHMLTVKTVISIKIVQVDNSSHCRAISNT